MGQNQVSCKDSCPCVQGPFSEVSMYTIDIRWFLYVLDPDI